MPQIRESNSVHTHLRLQLIAHRGDLIADRRAERARKRRAVNDNVRLTHARADIADLRQQRRHTGENDTRLPEQRLHRANYAQQRAANVGQQRRHAGRDGGAHGLNGRRRRADEEKVSITNHVDECSENARVARDGRRHLIVIVPAEHRHETGFKKRVWTIRG